MAKFYYNKRAFLCIGGPCAGKLYADTDRKDHFAVMVQAPFNWPEPGERPEDKLIAVRVIYVKRTIHTPEGDIMFWTPEDQTLADTLMLLFEAYNETNPHHS